MTLAPYSEKIDSVLRAEARDGEKAMILLDHYHTMSTDDREAMFAALAHRLMMETARGRNRKAA